MKSIMMYVPLLISLCICGCASTNERWHPKLDEVKPGWHSSLPEGQFEQLIDRLVEEARGHDEIALRLLLRVSAGTDTERGEYVQDAVIKVYDSLGRNEFIRVLVTEPGWSQREALINLGRYYGKTVFLYLCDDVYMEPECVTDDVDYLCQEQP